MNTFLRSRRAGNILGFLFCAGLMAYAFYAQYGLGLEPCPLCIFQRVAVIAVGTLFLLAALHNPGPRGARVYGGLLILSVMLGAAICVRHIWIQAQPPGTVAACGASLDYLMDIMPVTEVITKVLTGSGECGVVDWSLMGLSMPWWVLFSLLVAGAWAAYVNFFAAAREDAHHFTASSSSMIRS